MSMFNFKRNLCLNTDSYKVTHWLQFPVGATHSSYYIESRGGEYDELMFAGITFVQRVLEKGITVADVKRANKVYKKHFGADYFNYEGWMMIAEKMDGKIPVKIKALDEGTVVPVKHALAVIENTVEGFHWLPGWLEMFLLRAVWYQTTVATVSYHCKKAIVEYYDMTSDLTGADRAMSIKTRLHDFGGRGVSSEESAGLGGSAHLYNFVGTDTVEALIFTQELFKEAEDFMPGFSIPAREHSTTTCYGREGEMSAYMNSVTQFGKGIYACVMDSYDYEEAIKAIAEGEIKDFIIEQGGTFVARPDSGNMVDNIMFALNEFGKRFGYTVNSKGYKVLHPSVRIIQGDEIHSHKDIRRVLSWMEANKWSAENVAFGMGGGLLQLPNRDTLKFAMKMSAIKIDGKWMEVYKSPKGAEWKKSKKGRLTLIWTGKEYQTVNTLIDVFDWGQEILKLKLVNSEIVGMSTHEDVTMLSDMQAGV
ncbi:nicotinamide phosphoribosyl transferase [Cronobacter phage LPCS28]|uniref:Nicotinamide phosphoribosyltransferase n=1 Tax=Cronobacter phage LPCS28 TaxID=2924885 RepID=A0AAE9K803_9CAUD|nr:nicotinamide phosphoribosyl transferase [Cronobacter phage LPCS28]UNY46988.1 hypothetical protein EHEKIMEA_00106 [Cronobacter phage LPCS28]